MFDNVENSQLIQACWPVSPLGSVLVTSRNEAVSIDTTFGGLEVRLFTVEEASELLCAVIDRKNNTKSEQTSWVALVERLDGLPLALILTGMQIRRKHKKIEHFLRDHETDYMRHLKTLSGGVKNLYHQHNLETVYQTSFTSLGHRARSILGILSFLAPQDIPEDLFLLKDHHWFASQLDFCLESLQYGIFYD